MPAVLGAAVSLAGLGFVGLGAWARRDVARALAQERIVDAPDGPVTGPASARALADVIRESTLAATGGRTYSEAPAFVGADGEPTSDKTLALTDERTGAPVEHPDHALWVQSTTLQSALMQAYMAFRLAELTAAIGGAFVLAGLGLAASARR